MLCACIPCFLDSSDKVLRNKKVKRDTFLVGGSDFKICPKSSWDVQKLFVFRGRILIAHTPLVIWRPPSQAVKYKAVCVCVWERIVIFPWKGKPHHTHSLVSLAGKCGRTGWGGIVIRITCTHRVGQITSLYLQAMRRMTPPQFLITYLLTMYEFNAKCESNFSILSFHDRVLVLWPATLLFRFTLTVLISSQSKHQFSL